MESRLSPTTTQVDLSQLTQADLVNLRRHLMALVTMVDRLLIMSLTLAQQERKG